MENNTITHIKIQVYEDNEDYKKPGNLAIISNSVGLLATSLAKVNFVKSGWPFIINNDIDNIHFFGRTLKLGAMCVIVLEFTDYTLKEGDIIYPLNQFSNKITNEEIYKEACHEY